MPTTYAIPNGRTVMGAFTYTGNGASSSNTTQNITTPFYPDLAWVKGRNESFYHRLTSTGLTQPNYLSTNSTDAEGTLNDQISALASTYFQVKASGSGGTNQSGSTYVGWAWNANSGTTVSNASGSITSSVSANTTAGFSVVTYSGNATGGATVGHGLGVAPSMMIVKRRNATDDWRVYHISVGATQYIDLNTTAAAATANVVWNSTAPTSSVFSIGTSNSVNSSSGTYVGYCFAPVAGYSAFGSYTGNGSADGPFVYLGFRPAYLLVKRTDATNYWFVFDSARDTSNAVDLLLDPNDARAEISGALFFDFLSNGFKSRATDAGQNASGGTYIYMAFAENPFKYANAR